MQTVTIGSQVWMSQNLNVSTFRNGDSIPEAKTMQEWEKARQEEKPAWCYNDNNPLNGEKYGKLYNWHAVNDPRGLAPVGYHVPSEAEWTVLTDYLGDVVGEKMKSTIGWSKNGNGSNESGFNGLPGGERRARGGSFVLSGLSGSWWSASENEWGAIWGRLLRCDTVNIERLGFKKNCALSVRCLRD